MHAGPVMWNSVFQEFMGIKCAWFGQLNGDWYLTRSLPRTFRHNRSTRQNNAAYHDQVNLTNKDFLKENPKTLCVSWRVHQNDGFPVVDIPKNQTKYLWEEAIFTHDAAYAVKFRKQCISSIFRLFSPKKRKKVISVLEQIQCDSTL